MKITENNRRRQPARIRRIAVAAIATLSALAAVLAPAAAEAGTYHMYNCHVAGHETSGHGPWSYTAAYGAPGTTFWSACGGAGGPAGYEFGPYASGYLGANSRVDLTLMKDNSNISISGMKVWFTALTAIAPSYPAGPITATVWKDGVKYAEWAGGPTANYAATPLEMNPTHTVTLSLACSGSGLGCMPNGGFPLTVNGVQTDLVENVPPGASLSGGTLLSPVPQAGTKTVTVHGTDPDSGVRKYEVILDGQVVASVDYDRDWNRPLSEQDIGTCTYETWRACEAAKTVDLAVNTRLVNDGAHTLTARVTDAAGNTTTTAPQSVTIDNIPDPAPAQPVAGPTGPNGTNGANGANGAAGLTTVLTRNGTNASAQAAIKARFVGSASAKVRAKYGKKVQLTGQVLAPGGAPIVGAKVSVLAKDKSVGAQMVPVGEVTTDAHGRFLYTTVATRSRTVRFGYRANLEDVDFAKTIDFQLGVVPKISFRTDKGSLRNGQSVRFSGSIAGAPATAKKVVELQVRKGNGWQTFATTRLKKGRFSYAYRFKRTHGRVTYLFRARVREEAGFPFLSGTSKTRKATVRG